MDAVNNSFLSTFNKARNYINFIQYKHIFQILTYRQYLTLGLTKIGITLLAAIFIKQHKGNKFIIKDLKEIPKEIVVKKQDNIFSEIHTFKNLQYFLKITIDECGNHDILINKTDSIIIHFTSILKDALCKNRYDSVEQYKNIKLFYENHQYLHNKTIDIFINDIVGIIKNFQKIKVYENGFEYFDECRFSEKCIEGIRSEMIKIFEEQMSFYVVAEQTLSK